MRRNCIVSLSRALILTAISATPILAEPPKPMITGLKSPESVCLGLDGRAYVTCIGEFDKDGDGYIVAVADGKAVPFCEGLDDPKGIIAFKENFYVTDKTRVLKIDRNGKATVFAAAEAFPIKPLFLNDITADETGMMFVSDSGDTKGKGGAVFRIDLKGKVSLVADTSKAAFHTPNGLLNDSMHHMLVADFGTGELFRMKLSDASREKLAEGLGGADGLVWDHYGRLWISDWKTGKLFAIPRPGAKPVLVVEGFQAAADICLDQSGRNILVPDMKAGTLTAVPAQIPGAIVDDSPLPLTPELAFPDLEWTGWQSDLQGKPNPIRPIVLTHAGDGSNRVFVATQHGVIHTFANDPKATKTKIFLDIQERVRYDDKQNEEGFLGMAFHPNYKQNGELYVFYTVKSPKQTNIISRFKVKKDNPDQIDPASEEEIFRLSRPFWNHDGGTICFGPDGHLYVALGDGGLANDPYDNGQKAGSLLGKVLRLDVSTKSGEKKYGIPKDNPFVGKSEFAPEVYALGLRNPWRIAFDRKTGELWCADVGQNLWEEINILKAGGNYGWARREGLHPFGDKGVGPRPEYEDPIWVYHHAIGKSITGGSVYRGKNLPELDGHYLYADYVTNRLWALKYDANQKRVVANRPIPDKGFPVLSFGEDEQGEAYFMTYTASGRGIYRFGRAK